MSDVKDNPGPSQEDYPGPSHNHPEKQGQHPEGRADEEMVKPPARPGPPKKKSQRKRKTR